MRFRVTPPAPRKPNVGAFPSPQAVQRAFSRYTVTAEETILAEEMEEQAAQMSHLVALVSRSHSSKAARLLEPLKTEERKLRRVATQLKEGAALDEFDDDDDDEDIFNDLNRGLETMESLSSSSLNDEDQELLRMIQDQARTLKKVNADISIINKRRNAITSLNADEVENLRTYASLLGKGGGGRG
eukprot:GHVU01206277.1.p1 GENE.GHVU01206277.1~~GHVU01206277.1.p1  ORF type:complete len:186 (-),score=51.39 GHVU01206277.1:513-1070(-)